MRRWALFFDGTWNRPRARTSVYRLSELVAEEDDAGVPQQAEYVSGVGTAAGEWLRGGVLGFGTSRNIRHGYAWLAERVEDGDEIYVFGFSRGAFAARSLAGMIARCGLPSPGPGRDFGRAAEEAYRLYREKARGPAPGARFVPIHFVGVWDTVGALGVPWGNIRGLSRGTEQFHDTNPSARYRNAFHALAIDEHREAYAPTLWTGKAPLGPDQTLEQRWFCGAHSDVGGHRMTSDIGALPLSWIAGRAARCGLLIRPQPGFGDDDFLEPISDSFGKFLHGLYRLVRLGEPYFRTIGAERARDGSPPLNETIDSSVFSRYQQADPRYRPENLRVWAARRHLDLAALEGPEPAVSRESRPAG